MIPAIIVFMVAALLTYFFRRIDSKKEYDKESFEMYGIKAKTIYKSKPSNHKSFMKSFDLYTASNQEISEVQNEIDKKGFWEEHNEWRISTVTSSKIELKIKEGEKWYETTVKCEHEVKIPAKTIERAIIFKKVYEDFQMELWKELGWASWTKKNEM